MTVTERNWHPEDFTWAQRIAAGYNVTANIVYGRAGDVDLKLDVYGPWEIARRKPTLMFMHGGGWRPDASKESWSLWFLPFLQLGWTVVNVDYRSSGVAVAPAAVQDCLQALAWVSSNSDAYGLDLHQLVIAGLSAGAHLALTTGMIPQAVAAARIPSDTRTFARDLLRDLRGLARPAAIINWCGVTDVVDVTQGPHKQDFAVQWLGPGPDRTSMARLVSPLSYVCKGLPPVITIHGTDDQLVPYSHAARLHEALSADKVRSALIELPGAGHAALAAYLGAYPQVLAFLAECDVCVQRV